MNFLIVGAGISGTSLAFHLLNKKHQITIIDSGINNSSAIAAGMINPMTFRRMIHSWKSNELLAYCSSFYREIENLTSKKVLINRQIRRVFASTEEKNLWLQKQQEDQYKSCLQPLSQESFKNEEHILVDHGSGVVNTIGYVDVKTFLEATHLYLTEKIFFIKSKFDFNLFDPITRIYKDQKFDYVIFAEGYQGVQNPFFNYLPLNTTKGELLTAAIPGLDKNEIINRKCFVLPLADGTFKIGATFQWHTQNLSLTESAKEELTEKYNQLMKVPMEILSQEAGIRPTVIDRRPLIGEHPNYGGLYFFNGMGTKGYMLAPFFAKQLIDNILYLKPLDNEVNLTRFNPKT